MAIRTSASVNTLLRFWNIAKGIAGEDLVKLQSMPVTIALAGSEESRDWVASRLKIDPSHVTHYDSVKSATAAKEQVIFDTASLDSSRTDAAFKAAALTLIADQPKLRIALATKSDTLRPIVVEQITKEWASKNSKRAALDSLPGILPAFDFLLPLTGAGDMFVLTRNQLSMVLEIAACHGLAPDPKQRFTELLPVIGGALGWRALARQFIALVPFGAGLLVSAGIAYGGTYTVGRAVDYYYASGGKSIDLVQTFKSVSAEAFGRANQLVRRAPAILPGRHRGTAAS